MSATASLAEGPSAHGRSNAETSALSARAACTVSPFVPEMSDVGGLELADEERIYDSARAIVACGGTIEPLQKLEDPIAALEMASGWM
jgi:hypothetical protein